MSRPKGYHHTPETIEKMKRRKCSPALKRLLHKLRSGKNNPMYGKKHPKSIIKLLRKLNAGKNNGMWGKHHKPSTLKKLRSRIVSPETKKLLSELFLGEKSNFWKGGISKINLRIRALDAYNKWRLTVIKRDKNSCQKCGRKKCRLHAHHIKSLSKIIDNNHIKTTKQAINCTELWKISNGRTLCSSCHKLTENYMNRWG